MQGFGTERIDAELKKLFPAARIARMDRDAARGGEWLKILERMKRREIDILIGTQMITKGHDYSHLTLVGILEADQSLSLPDFRSAERTFQMLTQVSGRAGRAEKPGRVLIQTYQPQNDSIEAVILNDPETFLRKELQHRKDAGYPPFCRLIEIRLAGLHRETLVRKIQTLGARIEKIPGAWGDLLGPAPCVLEKIRNRFRWRLLIKTAHYTKIQIPLRRLLDDFASNDLPSSMRMLINVDPVDMM